MNELIDLNQVVDSITILIASIPIIIAFMIPQYMNQRVDNSKGEEISVFGKIVMSTVICAMVALFIPIPFMFLLQYETIDQEMSLIYATFFGGILGYVYKIVYKRLDL